MYAPAARPGGGGALEEALANADSYRRLGEQTYRRFVPDPIYRAAQDYLRWRFPLDPPGYCDAPAYLRDVDNDSGQNTLKSQVQEAVARPYRTVSQWRLAPNMNESLFGITSDIWVIFRQEHDQPSRLFRSIDRRPRRSSSRRSSASSATPRPRGARAHT